MPSKTIPALVNLVDRSLGKKGSTPKPIQLGDHYTLAVKKLEGDRSIVFCFKNRRGEASESVAVPARAKSRDRDSAGHKLAEVLRNLNGEFSGLEDAVLTAANGQLATGNREPQLATA